MENGIHQLMYASSARSSLTEDGLTQILSRAQVNNARNGITGILLHSDGNILQVIEGPKPSVDRLYAKIEQDTRHCNLLLLYRKDVEKRDFPRFKMGFRSASREQLERNFPAYTDIVERRRLPKEELSGLSTRVATFLRAFARTTRLDH